MPARSALAFFLTACAAWPNGLLEWRAPGPGFRGAVRGSCFERGLHGNERSTATSPSFALGNGAFLERYSRPRSVGPRMPEPKLERLRKLPHPDLAAKQAAVDQAKRRHDQLVAEAASLPRTVISKTEGDAKSEKLQLADLNNSRLTAGRQPDTQIPKYAPTAHY